MPKFTRDEHRTLENIDSKISALQNQYSKTRGGIQREWDAQRAKVIRLATDNTKPIRERKQLELGKLTALRDHELKAGSQRFDAMLTDLHKEFADEFQKLEAECTKSEADVSGKFGPQMQKMEDELQAKVAELQKSRDDIVDKAEKKEKENEKKQQLAKQSTVTTAPAAAVSAPAVANSPTAAAEPIIAEPAVLVPA